MLQKNAAHVAHHYTHLYLLASHFDCRLFFFLQNQLFGAGEDAQADAKKNLNKAQSAASSKGKEAEGNAKNAFETVQQNLSDAVENVQDSLKGKN